MFMQLVLLEKLLWCLVFCWARYQKIVVKVEIVRFDETYPCSYICGGFLKPFGLPCEKECFLFKC
jgi:hypothetical protein